MRAFVVTPGRPGSGRLADVAEPQPRSGDAVVDVLAVGVDGTDRELARGEYGEAPPGDDYLITGHESLGRVRVGAADLAAGELVVAVVRRPDPQPCLNCAAGEWDMCLNGRYTERGIKGAHGFLTERYAESPAFLVPVPRPLAAVAVLLEPVSIVEKALEQIRRLQTRLVWAPRRALVLGAGTIGTLATMLLRLDGLDVHLWSLGDGGVGARIAAEAGARFVSADDHPLGPTLAADLGPFDVVIEATGYSPLAFEAVNVLGPNGVVCLTGVSGGSRRMTIDAAHLNLDMVLHNKVVFGTVNANRRHFAAGVDHMRALEARWPGLLGRTITRRVPLAAYSPAELERGNELKIVVDVAA